MAFKRKTSSRRSPRSGLETRAHANRAFKRVTRQWQLSQNIKCQIVEAVSGPDCPNGGKINLLDQAELQGAAGFPANANFPDALRIRRIEGNLYFRPTTILSQNPDPVPNCYEVAIQALKTTYMRMGLRKAQAPQSQAGVPDALNPLNNGATNHEISDYADGRWMKLWEHVWDPRPRYHGISGNSFNCCTEQPTYVVPATVTGSQISYSVPAAVCVPCGDPETPAVNLSCDIEAGGLAWWHVRLHYGRTIVLKENDDLGLYFGWERMRETFDVARVTQPNIEFFGGIRLLLES